MFSGIVDHCGKVQKLIEKDASRVLHISSSFKDFERGESIAVNGVCLTVVEGKGGSFICELSPETLRLTNLGEVDVGSVLNLERSLRMGDRNGGHYVLGHVDAKLQVAALDRVGDYHILRVKGVLPEHQSYLIPKGSIALNGVSLTLNVVDKGGFEVCIIPHTFERTNLGLASSLNVEYDWMTKTIAHQVKEILALRRGGQDQRDGVEGIN